MSKQVKWFEHANPQPAILVMNPREYNPQRGLIKCEFCPCIFMAQSDFNRHMEVFGTDRTLHDTRFKNKHSQLEGNYNI